jgi:hypothetical protein
LLRPCSHRSIEEDVGLGSTEGPAERVWFSAVPRVALKALDTRPRGNDDQDLAALEQRGPVSLLEPDDLEVLGSQRRGAVRVGTAPGRQHRSFACSHSRDIERFRRRTEVPHPAGAKRQTGIGCAVEVEVAAVLVLLHHSFDVAVR